MEIIKIIIIIVIIKKRRRRKKKNVIYPKNSRTTVESKRLK